MGTLRQPLIGARRFAAALRLCEQAAGDGVVPGGVVLVADGGKVHLRAAFGRRQLEPRRLQAGPDTVYDVASLTKAAVTSVLAMQAVERGTLALDEPVATRLPELQGEGKQAIRLRHLLAHASGLPAHRPFYERLGDAPSARFAIAVAAAHEPLVYPTGSRSMYSDLGFILLGWLLERTAEARLDVQMRTAIAAPLGLRTATFVNLADGDERARLLARRRVAATQRCATRGRVLVGEVDDLNAFAMGGIAGHAGLFSDADDLGRIAGALAAAWRGEARAETLVARDVVREFWRPAGIPGSTWRLGWDGPADGDGSQAGRLLSRAAVGHLGFTGCSLWIDPERETWIVLLSNRIHPEIPTDDRVKRFRPAVHDAVLEALAY